MSQQNDQINGFPRCRYSFCVQPLTQIMLRITRRKDARTFEKPFRGHPIPLFKRITFGGFHHRMVGEYVLKLSSTQNSIIDFAYLSLTSS